MTTEAGFVESPVVFGRDRSLVGVRCNPVDAHDPSRPFVVFINAGIVHRAGPNRIYVRMARTLARTGFTSLRFDLSGIGDSVRPVGTEPVSIQDRVEMDIDDALAFGRDKHGAHTFVLIGLCSGADNALRTMRRDPRVVGSVLLDMNAPRSLGFYIRRYGRRLVRRDLWTEVVTGRHYRYRWLRDRLRGRRDDGHREEAGDLPEIMPDAWLPKDLMRSHLEGIIARRGRLLCVFTSGLDAYNYRKQFLHVFPGLDFNGCLRLEYFADSDHTFSRQSLQQRLMDTVTEWITETTSATSSERDRASL